MWEEYLPPNKTVLLLYNILKARGIFCVSFAEYVEKMYM